MDPRQLDAWLDQHTEWDCNEADGRWVYRPALDPGQRRVRALILEPQPCARCGRLVDDACTSARFREGQWWEICVPCKRVRDPDTGEWTLSTIQMAQRIERRRRSQLNREAQEATNRGHEHTDHTNLE